jgi:hypothetical protein
MVGSRTIVAGVAATLALVSAAPASAAPKSCGTVKGVGNGTSVTKVKTSSGSCTVAKSTAKAFARTRVAPGGYSCTEKFTSTNKANVTCRRTGRKITFKVAWNTAMPLPPAAAPPSTGGG